MDSSSVEKFELIGMFKARYGDKIHPELVAAKFCQDGIDFYMELFYSHSPDPVKRDLTMIRFEFDEDRDGYKIIHYFEGDDDFADNAKKLLEKCDTYTLDRLVTGLFEYKVSAEIKKYPPPDSLLQEPEDQK